MTVLHSPSSARQRYRRSRRLPLGVVVAAAVGLLGAPAAHAAPGDPAWVARYLPGRAQAADVGVSPDGARVFVTGSISMHGDFGGIETIAYDSTTGHALWATRYDGSDGGEDRAEALAVAPDGSTVYVTGASTASTGFDFVTAAYDASTGSVRWVRLFDDPSHFHDFAFAVVVSPDGARVFVTGETEASGTSEDWETIAYNATTGAELWADHRASIDVDAPAAIGVSPSGGTVYVTGTFESGSATAAFDAATGHLVWMNQTSAGDVTRDLAVAPDDSAVYVTGLTTFGERFFTTVAYDPATGTQMWAKKYKGPRRYSEANAIAVSPDGESVFVTGDSHGRGTLFDYATVAYRSSDGSQEWVRRYDGGPGADFPTDIGVDPAGAIVYVTGTSKVGFTRHDYATIAYDAVSGARLWVGRYDGGLSKNDRAATLAIAPDGNGVYVTGTSRGEGTRRDLATLAYRP